MVHIEHIKLGVGVNRWRWRNIRGDLAYPHRRAFLDVYITHTHTHTLG